MAGQDPAWLDVASDTSTSTSSGAEPSWTAPTISPSPPAGVIPTFKVILVGEVGVGKTAIFSWTRQRQHELGDVTSTSATIGVDSCTRTFSTRFGNVTLTLWDTAGVERFRTLTRNYYRNTHGALLVFSVDDPSSLFYLSRWHRDVVDSAPSAAHFLVGNKNDLARQVNDHSINTFSHSHDCQAAFLTSAKSGEGVEAALTAVCEHLVTKYNRHTDMEDRDKLWLQGSGLHVHGSGEHDVKKCC